jgi:hypothetical protein
MPFSSLFATHGLSVSSHLAATKSSKASFDLSEHAKRPKHFILRILPAEKVSRSPSPRRPSIPQAKKQIEMRPEPTMRQLRFENF